MQLPLYRDTPDRNTPQAPSVIACCIHLESCFASILVGRSRDRNLESTLALYQITFCEFAVPRVAKQEPYNCHPATKPKTI